MRKLSTYRRLLPLLAVLLCFDVAGPCAARGADKPKVIATISIIGDWAKIVGGDDIDLTTLVGPGGDPHEYQPVPADSMKLSSASLILENGLGLESWLDKLCESAQTKATRVAVTDGISVRHTSQDNNADDRDPHAWQNVKDAIAMVNNIRDALSKVDPAHADAYRSRAATYDQQLDALDHAIQEQIDGIPKNRRKVVTSHDAFGYFAQRYGLTISNNVLESVTTEAADPSARQIADVVDQIKASGVPVIFLENIQNPKLIEQIASEANVKVGPPLYSDAIGPTGSAGDTYLKMMAYNARTLADALKQ